VNAAAREAYRECEAITRHSAANFYYGIRLLSPHRREAMCAVYAFARRIDDIGDGTLARAEKLRRLDAQSEALAALPHGPTDKHDLTAGHGPTDAHDPVMVALADAYVSFEIPPDALQALIEGVRMDVQGVSYESFEELVLYCRRVAGAIGRACLAIFALRDPSGTDRVQAQQLADDLGVALQLTNILRDVREDAHNGRVYLPAEDLRRFGLIAVGAEPEAAATIVALSERTAIDGNGVRAGGVRSGDEPGEADWLDALIRFQAERARSWFERGIELAPLLDRRSAACLLAMAGIYSRLLTRIAAEPERALRERVSLPAHEKAWVATRSMFRGAR
jgi:phytoene synthase